MARPGPDPAHCIRAFELLSEGRSLAATREILRGEGVTIGSLETVRRWARAGARAASWLQESAAEKDENTTAEFVRQKYVQFLGSLLARGFDELDKGDGEYKDIAPIMARLAKEETLALGGYAATKGDLTVHGSFGELDPTTQAIVLEQQRQAAERDQQLLSGEES